MADKKKTFLDTLTEAERTIALKLKKAWIALKETSTSTPNQVNTADGKVLKFEGDLAVGVAVTLVDANGEVPAPAGDYTLEDGSIVTIDDKSTVGEIATADEEKKEGETMMSKVEFATLVKDLPKKSDFNKLNAEIKKVKAENEAYKIKLSKQEVLLGDLVTTVDAFMNLPTDNAIEEGGTTTVEFKELAAEEIEKLTSFQKVKYEKKLRDHKFSK